MLVAPKVGLGCNLSFLIVCSVSQGKRRVQGASGSIMRLLALLGTQGRGIGGGEARAMKRPPVLSTTPPFPAGHGPQRAPAV